MNCAIIAHALRQHYCRKPYSVRVQLHYIMYAVTFRLLIFEDLCHRASLYARACVAFKPFALLFTVAALVERKLQGIKSGKLAPAKVSGRNQTWQFHVLVEQSLLVEFFLDIDSKVNFCIRNMQREYELFFLNFALSLLLSMVYYEIYIQGC